MSIQFSCEFCGESFAVGDRFAGKRTKCPTCLVSLVVPTPAAPPDPVPAAATQPVGGGAVSASAPPPAPPAAGFDDFELVDDPAGSADDTVLDAVEVGTTAAKKTVVTESLKGKSAPAEPPPAKDDTPADPATAKPKKKKKRKPTNESGLAAMYMQEARAQEDRDAARAASGRREKGQGLTIGRVHITGGVMAGFGMLICGLFAMLFIFIFKDRLGLRDWRLFYGAIAGTSIGGITLFRALVLGSED